MAPTALTFVEAAINDQKAPVLLIRLLV